MMEQTVGCTASPTAEPLVSVRHLKKYFPLKKQSLFAREAPVVKAVDGVSFDIYRGQTLGMVGESGCGKSTLGRSILRLIEPTEGEVIFNGKDLTKMGKEELRRFRRDFQIVFQDPYASLNPRKTVGSTISEPFLIQKTATRQEAEEKAKELLELVGLRAEFFGRYPHEFSGGQRQRICFARALAVQPSFVVCDECVSALDVSIQAQIINLMMDLQKRLGLTYLFISHDLRVVKRISDRIAVMYLGKMIELADSNEIFQNTLHPYTISLLSAIPPSDPDKVRNRVMLSGDVPSPISPPAGCRFCTRCYRAQPICSQQAPELADCGNGHYCACHFPGNDRK